MAKLLVINPGSTSTKLAIFEADTLLQEKNIIHESSKDLSVEIETRLNLIRETLAEWNINVEDIDVYVARGGMLHGIKGGTYAINERMLADLRANKYGYHASNLGALLANELKGEKQAYIVDPVVVDEMSEVAKISGHPDYPRRSVWHALNQKAVSRAYCQDNGLKYEEVNLIVAHIGGGISVGAHYKGSCIDVNNALDGSGPFSGNRIGGLAVNEVIDYVLKNNKTKEEYAHYFTHECGLKAHLGTGSGLEVQELIKGGNEKAKLVYEAMIYQICKDIGALAAVLKGNVEAIIITGGFAYDDYLYKAIRERVGFIAEVVRYPGEDEMKALKDGALRVLRGEEKVEIYR